jgi:hypothetical protein
VIATQHMLLRALAAALCLALVGCSVETTDPPTAQATPNATATVIESSQSQDDPEANQANSAGNNGSSTSDDSSLATDATIVQTIRKDPNEKSELTQMKIEPGKERYFQNGLNDAELAYVRARNEKRRKARVEAAEARKKANNTGNDAPVFNPGGGELIKINN